jgi:hypothetical protein
MVALIHYTPAIILQRIACVLRQLKAVVCLAADPERTTSKVGVRYRLTPAFEAPIFGEERLEGMIKSPDKSLQLWFVRGVLVHMSLRAHA